MKQVQAKCNNNPGSACNAVIPFAIKMGDKVIVMTMDLSKSPMEFPRSHKDKNVR